MVFIWFLTFIGFIRFRILAIRKPSYFPYFGGGEVRIGILGAIYTRWKVVINAKVGFLIGGKVRVRREEIYN